MFIGLFSVFSFLFIRSFVICIYIWRFQPSTLRNAFSGIQLRPMVTMIVSTFILYFFFINLFPRSYLCHNDILSQQRIQNWTEKKKKQKQTGELTRIHDLLASRKTMLQSYWYWCWNFFFFNVFHSFSFDFCFEIAQVDGRIRRDFPMNVHVY